MKMGDSQSNKPPLSPKCWNSKAGISARTKDEEATNADDRKTKLQPKNPIKSLDVSRHLLSGHPGSGKLGTNNIATSGTGISDPKGMQGRVRNIKSLDINPSPSKSYPQDPKVSSASSPERYFQCFKSNLTRSSPSSPVLTMTNVTNVEMKKEQPNRSLRSGGGSANLMKSWFNQKSFDLGLFKSGSSENKSVSFERSEPKLINVSAKGSSPNSTSWHESQNSKGCKKSQPQYRGSQSSSSCTLPPSSPNLDSFRSKIVRGLSFSKQLSPKGRYKNSILSTTTSSSQDVGKSLVQDSKTVPTNSIVPRGSLMDRLKLSKTFARAGSTDKMITDGASLKGAANKSRELSTSLNLKLATLQKCHLTVQSSPSTRRKDPSSRYDDSSDETKDAEGQTSPDAFDPEEEGKTGPGLFLDGCVPKSFTPPVEGDEGGSVYQTPRESQGDILEAILPKQTHHDHGGIPFPTQDCHQTSDPRLSAGEYTKHGYDPESRDETLDDHKAAASIRPSDPSVEAVPLTIAPTDDLRVAIATIPDLTYKSKSDKSRNQEPERGDRTTLLRRIRNLGTTSSSNPRNSYTDIMALTEEGASDDLVGCSGIGSSSKPSSTGKKSSSVRRYKSMSSYIKYDDNDDHDTSPPNESKIWATLLPTKNKEVVKGDTNIGFFSKAAHHNQTTHRYKGKGLKAVNLSSKIGGKREGKATSKESQIHHHNVRISSKYQKRTSRSDINIHYTTSSKDHNHNYNHSHHRLVHSSPHCTRSRVHGSSNPLMQKSLDSYMDPRGVGNERSNSQTFAYGDGSVPNTSNVKLHNPILYHGGFKNTRHHIIQEIYDTESSYVDSLGALIEMYYKPMISNESSLTLEKEVVSKVFGPTPDILNYHQKFLQNLDSRLHSFDEDTNIGDLFQEMFRSQDVIESYLYFVTNWRKAKEVLKDLKSQNSKFSKFLEKQTSFHRGRLNLDALIIMPIQRIPRYELLLKELIRNTDIEHSDITNLMNAQELIHSLALKIDGLEKKADENSNNQEVIGYISNLMEGLDDDGQGLNPSLKFIRYDFVNMKIDEASNKTRCLFLFADLLIITSPKKRKNAFLKKSLSSSNVLDSALLDNYKFKFLLKISLNDISIKETTKYDNDYISEIEKDLCSMSKIFQLASHLEFPHQTLEEALTMQDRYLKDKLKDIKLNEPEDMEQNSIVITYVTVEQNQETLHFIFEDCKRKESWHDEIRKLKKIKPHDQNLSFVKSHTLPKQKNDNPVEVTACSKGYLPNLGLWIAVIANAKTHLIYLNPSTLETEYKICNIGTSPITVVYCALDVDAIAGEVSHKPKNGLSSINEEVSQAKLKCLFSIDSVSSDSENDKTGGCSNNINGGEESNENKNSTTDKSQPENRLWIGTKDGELLIYDVTDAKYATNGPNRSLDLKAEILDVIHFRHKLYVSTYDCKVHIIDEDIALRDTQIPQKIDLINLHYSNEPIKQFLVVHFLIWCSTDHNILILNPYEDIIETVFDACHKNDTIGQMVNSPAGVWIYTKQRSIISLLDSLTYKPIFRIDFGPALRDTWMLINKSKLKYERGGPEGVLEKISADYETLPPTLRSEESCDSLKPLVRRSNSASESSHRDSAGPGTSPKLGITSILYLKDKFWVSTSYGTIFAFPTANVKLKDFATIWDKIEYALPEAHEHRCTFLTFTELTHETRRTGATNYTKDESNTALAYSMGESFRSAPDMKDLSSHEEIISLAKRLKMRRKSSLSAALKDSNFYVISLGDGFVKREQKRLLNNMPYFEVVTKSRRQTTPISRQNVLQNDRVGADDQGARGGGKIHGDKKIITTTASEVGICPNKKMETCTQQPSGPNILIWKC